jgi:hypothetical protein
VIISAKAKSLFEKLNATYPDQKVPLFAATARRFEHFKMCHDTPPPPDLKPAHSLASPSPVSLNLFDYFL